MSRNPYVTPVDFSQKLEAALDEEREAHAQSRAALATANVKLEAVGELPGKWRGSEWRSGFARYRELQCATDLEATLASTGPSLREKVGKALQVIRAREIEMDDGSTDYVVGLSNAADLVQAALDGE